MEAEAHEDEEKMCEVMNERLQSVFVVEEELKQPDIDRRPLQMEILMIGVN